MGSHSVTCHPTEVRIPPLPSTEAGTRFSDPGGMQGWVECLLVVDGSVLETVKDLIRLLRYDNDSCDVRRQLGEVEIVSRDLLPIIKQYHDDRILFDTVIRLAAIRWVLWCVDVRAVTFGTVGRHRIAYWWWSIARGIFAWSITGLNSMIMSSITCVFIYKLISLCPHCHFWMPIMQPC